MARKNSIVRFAVVGVIALLAVTLVSSVLSPRSPEPPVIIEHHAGELTATTLAKLENNVLRADLDRPMTDQEVSARSISAVEVVAPAVVVVHRIASSGSPELLGSGVAIDASGHILASLAVTGTDGEVRVTWSTGITAPARIVRIDTRYQLVLLRAEGGSPEFAAIADYPSRPGDRVLAIGSPLEDFASSVTGGIIGAIGVPVPAEVTGVEIPGLLQHDAAINPGNSGGPIVDLNGNVVGINIMSIVRQGTDLVQGWSFAVPASALTRILADIE